MEQEKVNVPTLRGDLQFRPISAGRVFIYGPGVDSLPVDERVAQALRLCQGQPISEVLPEVQAVLEYDATAEEFLGYLERLEARGFFIGHPKKTKYVRLFDPAPAVEFLMRRCRWLFTSFTVAGLFGFLALGVWQLLAHWDLFVSQVTAATAGRPWLSMILYYTLFIPVGLLHELGHAVVCRRFGGETLEVGFVLSSANPVVKSNTAALETDRAKILYYAGGVFLDMFVFFILVNIWLRWPNYWTTLLLLPQTVFVLLFSYTMQAEQDFPKIVSQWTGIPEAGGRRAFLKEWLKNPPQKGLRTERTLVYAGTMVLQTVVFAFLVWSFRSPASVSLFPGVQVVLPFWPPILYVLYRMIRYTIFNFGRLTARLFPRPAEQTG